MNRVNRPKLNVAYTLFIRNSSPVTVNLYLKCKFPGCKPLFILSVYMPSSNNALDEYREYLDFLWALYDSLSADTLFWSWVT